MKQNIFIFLFVIITVPLLGQTASDVLRYSYWNYGGSARYMATGGSMGALGGDYSTIISNPASIATFRRSEISFTPGILVSGTDAAFDGSTFSETKVSGNVNQASVIFATAKPGKWKTINFGIGYNRLADFSQKFNYAGRANGSIANYFLNLSQGLRPVQLSDYDNGLAYDTELIYEIEPGVYENDLFAGDATTKFQNVENTGSMGELNISLGGNINHKLYLGASMGVPFINFNQSKIYEETDADQSILYFNGLTYNEALNTSGIGFNINLGAIYRINQSVRVGAAFHSPTWMTLTDTYSSKLDFDITYNEGETGASRVTNSAESPIGNYEYNQRTPLRLIGNIGVIIKKLGFVSAEVEYLNYGKNKYNFGDALSSGDLQIERELNNAISDIYQSAVNLKTGAEFVIAENYRARAGYNLMGNPYTNNAGIFNDQQFSLGAGYRKDNFFVDIAYLHRTDTQFYQPYNVGEASPRIVNDLTSDYILMTFGLKFGGKKTRRR